MTLHRSDSEYPSLSLALMGFRNLGFKFWWWMSAA